jgi:hypothetical protein
MNSPRSAALRVATLAVMLAWAAPASAVPITFAGTGNAYELIFAGGISWYDAEAAALASFYEGSQGHLATVTSAAENEFIATSIQQQTSEWWIGGFQAPGSPEPGGGWSWVNGEGAIPDTASLIPYANWAPGEPNDHNGGEMFLMIYGGASFNGLWNDAAVVPNIAGYVIEYDNVESDNVVPEPATLILVGAGVLAVACGRARRRKTHDR